MKRNIILICMAMFMVAYSTYAQRIRTCAAEDRYQEMLKTQPWLKDKREQMEKHTQAYLKRVKNHRLENGIVIIPIVVHVVYNTASENVSQAQIESQITVLNKDFRKLNPDVSQTPAEFAGRAADAKIQFELASVTRTQTSKASFGTNDDMKFNSKGGKDAWDSKKYLNMWVCDLGTQLLGYAQFPNTGNANTDGVVVHHKYFGTTGTATAPFNLGRTATHEIGHWLNLRHIWGDGDCSQDDFVSDTPNQGKSYNGKPTHPQQTCSSNDMFMNYMDYVDDAAMVMFSTGQKDRMWATFEAGGGRETFKTSSGGGACGTPASLTASTITKTSATLNWGTVTGANNYDVRYRKQGTSNWTTSTAVSGTSRAISGLTAGTTYEFQAKANCSIAGAYSASQTFKTTANTSVTYCVSKGNSTEYEHIKRVKFGTIDNTSNSNGGYKDFTALSTSVAAGASATVTVTPGFAGSAYSEGFRVWIDFNQDGDFNDAGEQVLNKTSSSAVSASVTVPASAKTGATRMRVSMKYNARPTACETFSEGEVEDYTVNITGGSRLIIGGEQAAEILKSAVLYPNPMLGNQTNLKVVTRAATKLNIMVMSLQGRVANQQSVEATQGHNSFELKLNNLKPGVYLLKVNTGNGEQITRRMIRIK